MTTECVTSKTDKDMKWPNKIFTLLFCGFIFYTLSTSDWYWKCKAQIDPATLIENCPPPKLVGQATAESGSIEDDFGAHSPSYESLAPFWGDDPISNFFSTISRPFSENFDLLLTKHLVPFWNRTVEPDITRVLPYGVISSILGAIAANVVRDLYKSLKMRFTRRIT